MTQSANRNHAIVLVSGLLLAGLVVAGVFYAGKRELPEAPLCDCQLLEEWIVGLPLTPDGGHLATHEVMVIEGAKGFLAGGSGMEGVILDRGALVDSLTASGLNHHTIVDRPDFWNVAFYPGTSQFGSPWSFEVITTEGKVGARVRVTVDGSPWGLETIDDLHEFYRDEPEAARAAQGERQRQAIEILELVRVALEAMVEDS